MIWIISQVLDNPQVSTGERLDKVCDCGCQMLPKTIELSPMTICDRSMFIVFGLNNPSNNQLTNQMRLKTPNRILIIFDSHETMLLWGSISSYGGTMSKGQFVYNPNWLLMIVCVCVLQMVSTDLLDVVCTSLRWYISSRGPVGLCVGWLVGWLVGGVGIECVRPAIECLLFINVCSLSQWCLSQPIVSLIAPVGGGD